MQIKGIAHVQLSVTDFAKSREFYRALLGYFEMTVLYDVDDAVFYSIGGKTGLMITPCPEEFRGERFHQRKPGLHHLCFRATSREDIDALHAFLVSRGVVIVHPPEDAPWAKGYYSILFEDPDGIRLEVNFIPGKGKLDESAELPPRGEL
jgi:catechol 2,3-dioxygenase-like lactoylglutathione lyase family enzyme